MSVPVWKTHRVIKEWKWREAYDDEQTTKDVAHTSVSLPLLQGPAQEDLCFALVLQR